MRGAAGIKNRRQGFAGIAEAEPQPAAAQHKGKQRRLEQSLEIQHQVELPAPAADEPAQIAQLGDPASAGFEIEDQDAVDARKIFQQGGSGRLRDPGDMGGGKMPAQGLQGRQGVHDVSQRRQADNGNGFQISRTIP